MAAQLEELILSTTARQASPYVVVGTGPVGIQSARKIQQEHPGHPIIVYGDEPWLPYNRVRLSSLLAGEISSEEIYEAEDLGSQQYMEFRHNRRIVAINRGERYVEDEHGHRQPYHKLVLATGSAPHVPNIDGTGLSGVFTFRDMSDAQSLAARRVRSRKTVVLGGGLLGIETAKAMQRNHTEVTLIEHSPRLMPRQLSAAASAILREYLMSEGLRIILFDAVKCILGDQAATGVLLQSGKTIHCDTIIIATGIKPNIELARSAGLHLGRGIKVDDRMQTSDPHIYAAGECAEHDGMVHGLVGPGLEQAAVAARNLTGGNATYHGNIAATQLKVLRKAVFSMGVVADDMLETTDNIIEYEQTGKGTYRALVIRHNRLVGCVALGDYAEANRIQDAISKKKRIWFWQLWRFARSGTLWPQVDAGNVQSWPARAVVCNCTGITCGQLRASIKQCADVEQLALATGASTVCGTCRPLLAQMFGDNTETSLPSRPWLTATSGLALLLTAIFALLGPIPWSSSIQGLRIDQLWIDGLWKQISGFSLLGVSLLISLISLRKRWRRFSWGDFAHWRLVHVATGVALIVLLMVHTGLHLGSNLNFFLLCGFLAALFLGGGAGLVAALESSMGPARAKRLRSRLNLAHLLALWPVPVLLTYHVLTVYYF